MNSTIGWKGSGLVDVVLEFTYCQILLTAGFMLKSNPFGRIFTFRMISFLWFKSTDETKIKYKGKERAEWKLVHRSRSIAAI